MDVKASRNQMNHSSTNRVLVTEALSMGVLGSYKYLKKIDAVNGNKTIW